MIIVDVFRNHKYPILYSLTVKAGEHKYKFHDCRGYNCIYDSDQKCPRICKVLEETKIIWEFAKEEFGISFFNLILIPIEKHECK